MKELKPALLLFIVFTVICGGAYPALVTGVAGILFPAQAGGSLVADRSGRPVGSSLIGQAFSGPGYFWPRPSATSDYPYNPAGSSGSNRGPTNPDFLKTVAERVKALRDAGATGRIPADLVEASASGLDPHITPEAVETQLQRVAKARGVGAGELRRLVAKHTADRQLGFLGERRVNVLALNLDLDALGQRPDSARNPERQP